MGTAHVLEAVARRAVGARGRDRHQRQVLRETRVAPALSRERRRWAATIHTARSKGCAELVTAAYRAIVLRRRAGHRVASARAGNVIGGGDWARGPDRARSHAAPRVGTAGDLSGNPKSVRPWQHVLEPLGGYLLLAHRAAGEGQRFAGPWNFGPPVEESVSVGELVERLRRRWPEVAVEYRADDNGPHEAAVLRLDSPKRARSWAGDRSLGLDDDARYDRSVVPRSRIRVTPRKMTRQSDRTNMSVAREPGGTLSMIRAKPPRRCRTPAASPPRCACPTASTVHGEEEIAAVVEVLRTSTQMGANVREVRGRRVAALFAKRHGIMVNSGSSANYLAIELLGLPQGAEVITPALTFATTVAPLVRDGLVPAFVDVEPDTFNIDVGQIEAMIAPQTQSAMMVPSLIGNLPDWDRIAEIAAAHDLLVVEDSADTLGATLRGTSTGTRSDISTTSFYGSHVINCAGNGGMLCVNDETVARRGAAAAQLGTQLVAVRRFRETSRSALG